MQGPQQNCLSYRVALQSNRKVNMENSTFTELADGMKPMSETHVPYETYVGKPYFNHQALGVTSTWSENNLVSGATAR